MLGILLIDKPLGITSHDVVNSIRRKLGTKRVGHAGTLDPLGTGLLVVAVGPATRFLQYLPLEPKEYEGTITFGKRTNTYDAEGEVIGEGPVPTDLMAQLEALKPKFLGLIEQIPPMHSAVKVAGKPLYKYARAGQDVERQIRTIHISELELTAVDDVSVDYRLVCSGGTYVRTLADDLGQAIGCGAYLTRLRRTRVGRFSLQGSVALDEVAAARLIPLNRALAPMPILELNDRQVAAIREGQQVTVSTGSSPAKQAGGADAGGGGGAHGARSSPIHGGGPEGGGGANAALDPNSSPAEDNLRLNIVALADPLGQVFSVARLVGNLVQPECVIPSEALSSEGLAEGGT